MPVSLFSSHHFSNELVQERNKLSTLVLLKLLFCSNTYQEHKPLDRLRRSIQKLFITFFHALLLKQTHSHINSHTHMNTNMTPYLWKDPGTCHWSSSSSTSRVWIVFLVKTACLAAAVMHGNSEYWWRRPPPRHSWPKMMTSPTHQLEDTHARIQKHIISHDRKYKKHALVFSPIYSASTINILYYINKQIEIFC